MIEQHPDAPFHFSAIPPSLVERFWQFAEPYVKRALDHTSGEFLPADIKALCKDQIIQLWLVTEGPKVVGAVTTEIVVYPNRRHLRVITLGGSKAKEWTSLVDTILSDFAKTEKCDAMEAFVRKGYVPVLAEYGFKLTYSVVIKDIG